MRTETRWRCLSWAMEEGGAVLIPRLVEALLGKEEGARWGSGR